LLTVQNPAKTVYFKTYSRSSVWPCWWSSVADHPILFARHSSARRWYFAWVEISCSV